MVLSFLECLMASVHHHAEVREWPDLTSKVVGCVIDGD
jgi:hypothetical protein